MKNTLSVNRIEANRMNALKSTGPKSAEGKAVSRMNGLKHGILAREVVLRSRVDGERGREFQALQRLYWEHLAPVGPLEEMLVERIVTAYWRLHRVVIAERGEILCSLEEDRERSEMMKMSGLLPAVIGGRAMPLPWTYSTAGAIERARNCVRRGEELTEPLLGQLVNLLEDRPGMISDLQKVREFVPDNAEGLSAEAGPGRATAMPVEVSQPTPEVLRGRIRGGGGDGGRESESASGRVAFAGAEGCGEATAI